MSTAAAHKKLTPLALETRKAATGFTPIVCLTCYSHYMAQLMDGTADLLLVGDSLGMVMYGLSSTLETTLDMMVAHGKAVVRGAPRSCVVVDMPFGTYQESPQIAYRNAAYVMAQTGCDAVKLEGGAEMAETIAFLTARGIPVMGHIGLKPQSVRMHGGYTVQGRGDAARNALLADARAVETAGAFSVVLECLERGIADRITETLRIPTIGIGASLSCDGQILVTEDMLGLTSGKKPKFVKPYGNVRGETVKAIESYADDVRGKLYPSDEYMYA